MDCTENNPNIAPEPLIEDMDRFNLNLMYSKMSDKNSAQTNKMSGGLRNVASIISTASEFPPFPISLVMKIDEPSMELRLPLLNSTFSDSLGMTHTVLDEYGILGSEIFQFKFPGNEHTVNVQAADDKYKKTLKTKIENSELKENGFKNGTTINWSNKRNAFQPVVENSIRNIPENIRQDLIFLDCESTNNLTMNKNDLKGLDFCILPAGELLIGRSSTGEWTIFYREPNKISQQENAAISGIFQKCRNIQDKSDLDNVSETTFKENISIKSETSDNILGLSHQKSHNKTPNHASESNITGQQKEVVENIGQAKPPNVTFFIEQRQHSNPSVQHFQGNQSPAVTLPQDTTSVNQRQCSKPVVQHFQIQQPPVTIATNTQSALHPTLQQLPVLVPIATMGQYSRPVTHSSVFQQSPVVKATNQQYPKSTLNHPSIQQPPVTIATNEPRPVMMIHSNGKALKLIPLDKNVSANFIAKEQQIAQDDSLKVKVELPPESENDVEVKVKEEPVDTGYEEDIPNVETLQEINTSNMFVRMPSVNRSGSSDGEQSSSFQKTGQKRKPPESEMPTCSKYMLINQVSSVTEKSPDNPPSISEEREYSNISMGVDSDSVSGTGDPDSVRSGRFPVVNEVESDAVIYRCTEPTAGTQRQTKWGVSTFREWLKERNFDTDFEQLPVEDLDEKLEKFYAELRTSEGKIYAITSFRGIRSSINRHLTSEPYNRSICLFTDSEFPKSNKVFKAMMRKISHVTVKSDPPLPISVEDMQKLRTSDVLSVNTPKGLLNKVWFDLTLNFTFKNSPKARNYKLNMFQFKTDKSGLEFVELKDPDRPSADMFSPRMYATRDAFCPVASLMKYLTKRNTMIDAFFQQPRCHKSITDDSWYTSRPLGSRQLLKMMENISTEAGLSRIYTNVGLKEVLLRSQLNSCHFMQFN